MGGKKLIRQDKQGKPGHSEFLFLFSPWILALNQIQDAYKPPSKNRR